MPEQSPFDAWTWGYCERCEREVQATFVQLTMRTLKVLAPHTTYKTFGASEIRPVNQLCPGTGQPIPYEEKGYKDDKSLSGRTTD